MDGYARLTAFLQSLRGDLYPEPGSKHHHTLTGKMIDRLAADGHVKAGTRVLDMGCGQGVALERFREIGAKAVGITLGADYQACRDKGLDVREMDMAFPDFEDASFDLVWCRHALEHSVFPLFTLSEIRRMLVRGGLVYIEVPAPDTSCHHERNPNHYSVLGRSMWESLFARARFQGVFALDINFRLASGPDTYWAFLLRRPD